VFNISIAAGSFVADSLVKPTITVKTIAASFLFGSAIIPYHENDHVPHSKLYPQEGWSYPA